MRKLIYLGVLLVAGCGLFENPVEPPKEEPIPSSGYFYYEITPTSTRQETKLAIRNIQGKNENGVVSITSTVFSRLKIPGHEGDGWVFMPEKFIEADGSESTVDFTLLPGEITIISSNASRPVSKFSVEISIFN